jgi:predicted dehydrogenase
VNASVFGWGVVAPGRIAQQFAQALHGVPGARLAGVCGRDLARSQAFAAQWSAPQAAPAVAHAELSSLLADPAVHAVYVASPHSAHADAVQRCLAAGRPVLCEKPLTPNAAQTRALIDASRLHRTFLMEAVWTRFLPIYATIGRWLSQGAIGRLRGMQSSFCFNLPFEATGRHFDPLQAGGALLDIGIYNLTVSRWAAGAVAAGGAVPGAAVQRFDVAGTLAPTGVDQRVWATLDFGDGLVSQFVCGFDGSARNAFRIDGEHGHVVIEPNFWQATAATLVRSGHEPERASAPHRVNGFEYEIEEAMRCVRAGLIESPGIPHAETLAVAELMDAMRLRLGVRYPFE